MAVQFAPHPVHPGQEAVDGVVVGQAPMRRLPDEGPEVVRHAQPHDALLFFSDGPEN